MNVQKLGNVIYKSTQKGRATYSINFHKVTQYRYLKKSENSASLLLTKAVGAPTARLHHTNDPKKLLKLPDVIYVPHFWRWLKMKFWFKYLQLTWDPEFSEGAFIYGTINAMCRVTEAINENDKVKLKELLTNAAVQKLEKQMVLFQDIHRQAVRLEPDNIKLMVPLSMTFKKEGHMKTCNVTMRTLGMKFFEENIHTKRLVMVSIETEFVRDYAEGKLPEWSVNRFDFLHILIF